MCCHFITDYAREYYEKMTKFVKFKSMYCDTFINL